MIVSNNGRRSDSGMRSVSSCHMARQRGWWTVARRNCKQLFVLKSCNTYFFELGECLMAQSQSSMMSVSVRHCSESLGQFHIAWGWPLYHLTGLHWGVRCQLIIVINKNNKNSWDWNMWAAAGCLWNSDLQLSVIFASHLSLGVIFADSCWLYPYVFWPQIDARVNYFKLLLSSSPTIPGENSQLHSVQLWNIWLFVMPIVDFS